MSPSKHNPQNVISPQSTLRGPKKSADAEHKPRKSLNASTSNPTPVAPDHKPNRSNPTPHSTGQDQPQQPQHPPRQKKLARKSSKPIINWFQRKLTGTGRQRRASEADGLRNPRPVPQRRQNGGQDRQRKRPNSPPVQSKRPIVPPVSTNFATSRAISLDSQDGYESAPETTGDRSEYGYEGSSLARVSTWSPASILEADDNASLRPLPPSAPPSPSPSHSSASYLSDPRTFRSMTASTNPTTILSIDIAGGLAHIAQVPTPVSAGPWFGQHVRNSSLDVPVGSGNSITFSALPPSPTVSRPPSPSNTTTGATRPVQAPLHTAHHPRNNPRPFSPPLDNASLLTLASSAFGIPGARIGANALSYGGDRERSIIGAGDSISHISGLLGDDERLFNDGEVDRDVNASVRALRPRSSRRGSWESESSGWSAAVTGSGYQRNRSLWTSNSIGPGDALTVDIDEENDGENDNDMTSVEGSAGNPIPNAADLSIADTVSETTDDGKTRHRSNTITASEDGASSPLSTPTEPLPSAQLPDPDPTPKVNKEFVGAQGNPRTSGEQLLPADEPWTTPKRTPAVIPDAQHGVVSA
ncbi:hypothetical protein BJ322DRAFT_1087979 [Thelephora terrestris]|uniref:Uncharacterized protein n=1 Tax=Thelephora terrestris TaxID=56493 RepID=A0A9P6L2M6_9AGAM|nr:hypothetical protein BJ322DRAFT_1087979 [Thelephora terrestris]